MTKIEIETITEAMTKKQTWIRKELNDFLDVWADITKDTISGHTRFVLYDFVTNEFSKRIVLVRGYAQVDTETYDHYTESWTAGENWMSIPNTPTWKIRKIINHINSGLTKYFKDIQADIGDLDETGMKIADIIEKLK